MTKIYSDEKIKYYLDVLLDKTIKDLKEENKNIDIPVGELSGYIRHLGFLFDNDNLLFLFSLINFLPSIYYSVRTRLETKRTEAEKEEEKEINKQLKELNRISKEIFMETLEKFKEILSKNDENEMIKLFKEAHIKMLKDIFNKFR